MNLVINAVLFQLTWIAAVAGAGYGYWWPGVVMLSVFAAWQLRDPRSRRHDLRLIAWALPIGLLVDTLWIQTGMLRYAVPLPWPELAPVWIMVLWVAFALTLNHSLRALKQRPWLAATLGLIGGPLAYWIAASAWGAAEIRWPMWAALGALALAWGLLTPLLCRLAEARTPPAAGTVALPRA
jgi:hypothetical protein